jgi:membrane-bound lytic murein transglycosylase A
LIACSTPPPLLPQAEPQLSRDAAPATPVQRASLLRPAARWVAAEWSELPGWGDDDALAWWPALLASCGRPAPGWAALCARAQLQGPGDRADIHRWLTQHLRPWQVQSLAGEPEGLMTGYFEPQVVASPVRLNSHPWPLLSLPPDPQLRRASRREIDTQAQRFAPLAIAWLSDPIDLLQLQIQGSGRLLVRDPLGTERLARVAYAGHNDQPFESVAKALIERGELRPGEAGWTPLRDWARRNPERAREALWLNPRYVYFREEPLPDAAVGPRGAQGVPLTPGRSVAVDRNSIPYGTPLWLQAAESTTAAPLRRLVMAQDTGSAISGAVRADFFWGWGPEAELQAGRTKQTLRVWALWPRDGVPPS